MKREEMLTRFNLAYRHVESLEQAANAIGVSLSALEKCLERARAAGDERGVYAPLHIKTPRNRRTRRESVLAGWEALEEPRPTYGEAAAIIGCTRAALANTLSRARKEGITVGPAGYRADTSSELDDWVVGL